MSLLAPLPRSAAILFALLLAAAGTACSDSGGSSDVSYSLPDTGGADHHADKQAGRRVQPHHRGTSLRPDTGPVMRCLSTLPR